MVKELAGQDHAPESAPRAMVKSAFSLILHSPYIALDLSTPIAKKPTMPVRRSQIPSASNGRLLEMHSKKLKN